MPPERKRGFAPLRDANREFAKKFAPQNKGIYPTMVHRLAVGVALERLDRLEIVRHRRIDALSLR